MLGDIVSAEEPGDSAGDSLSNFLMCMCEEPMDKGAARIGMVAVHLATGKGKVRRWIEHHRGSLQKGICEQENRNIMMCGFMMGNLRTIGKCDCNSWPNILEGDIIFDEFVDSYSRTEIDTRLTHIQVYIYICVCVCACIYIYIYMSGIWSCVFPFNRAPCMHSYILPIYV